MSESNSAADNQQLEEEIVSKTYTTLTEMFEDECALALELGLTYSEYWEGELSMMVPFAKFHIKKLREDFISKDTLAWLIGSYVCTAVGTNLESMTAKKGSPKKIKYPEQPLFIDVFDEEAARKKQERETLRSYNNFLAAIQCNDVKLLRAANT